MSLVLIHGPICLSDNIIHIADRAAVNGIAKRNAVSFRLACILDPLDQIPCPGIIHSFLYHQKFITAHADNMILICKADKNV